MKGQEGRGRNGIKCDAPEKEQARAGNDVCAKGEGLVRV
jgi:hypothetical protein